MLRRVALLETAVPLILTVLGGVATVLLVAAIVSQDGIVLPSAGYFAGVGTAVLIALGVSTISLPLMDVATWVDAVRFE